MVTIYARVQSLPDAKAVSLTPAVTPFMLHHTMDSYAHSGTSANDRKNIHAPVKPLPCA
ncbi:hypothetical protein ACOMD2_01190 [Hominicoprocola fusiformis]